MDDVKVTGFGRQRNDGGGCAKMRKIGMSGEPWCICNCLSFTRTFLFDPVFFRTALLCSGGYHLDRGGM